MDWDAIGATAEAFGAITVIVTLLYLLRQMTQQSRVAQAQVQQQRADSVYQIAAQFMSSSEDMEFLYKLMRSDADELEKLSAFDIFKARVALSPLRANLENTYEQYCSGFISEEYYRQVHVELCKTYGRPILALNLPLTDNFRRELSKLVENRS